MEAVLSRLAKAAMIESGPSSPRIVRREAVTPAKAPEAKAPHIPTEAEIAKEKRVRAAQSASNAVAPCLSSPPPRPAMISHSAPMLSPSVSAESLDPRRVAKVSQVKH